MNARLDPSDTDLESAAATATVDLYQKPPRIHPRAVRGRHADLRTVLRYGQFGIVVALPWLTLGGEPLVHFDLPAREAHLVGITLYAQDTIYAAGALIVGAFALFAITNWLGRVWCGYACPHSVFFQIFVDIESWIEGSPRRRRAAQTWVWSLRHIRRKLTKWTLWTGVACAFAFSVVGLFVPAHALAGDLTAFSAGPWPLFWLAFLTLATLGMGALLREQVCLYMCPYARFQSAMFDADTLIVSYDAQRGEPRRQRKSRSPAQGDCVDCSICVQVCPTGIDIRDGLQYECISCAHCIDACDTVMLRTGRAPGLIRYTTERSLSGAPAPALRYRLAGYLAALLVVSVILVLGAIGRAPAAIEVTRGRDTLFREVRTDDALRIENHYEIRIANRTETEQRWTLTIRESDGLSLAEFDALQVPAGRTRTLPVRLHGPGPGPDTPLTRPVIFVLTSDAGEEMSVETTFFTGVR